MNENFYDVRSYGAHSITETGYSMFDSTEAIKATLNDIPAGGGIVYVPPGKYKITSTILVGNADLAAVNHSASTKNGITFLGGGTGMTDTEMASTAGATEFIWEGASGGTMLKINGPIQGCTVGNFVLDGNNLATILFDVNYGHDVVLRNILGRRWQGGFGIRVATMGTAWTGGSGIMGISAFYNVKLDDPGKDANGLTIAPEGSGNVCEITFDSCDFGVSYTPASIQVQLGYCDHITFVRCCSSKRSKWTGAYDAGTTYGLYNNVTFGEKTYISLSDDNTGNTPDSSPTYWVIQDITAIGVEIKPIIGFGGWPQNIMFIGCPIVGGVKYNPENQAYKGIYGYALTYYPYVTIDSQACPPLAYDGVTWLPATLVGGISDSGQTIAIPKQVYQTVASASRIKITGQVIRLTGKKTVNKIDVISGGVWGHPIGMNLIHGAMRITIIPDSNVATGTSGNIQEAESMIANRAYDFQYIVATSKWHRVH